MSKLSENYYSREYFLKTKQVPTQSLIAHKMGKPLADVYFKSMSYKHKVLAGLEPPLKGGGSDWYVPPKELLKGNVALKPEDKKHLTKLGSDGIIHFGELLITRYLQNRAREIQQGLIDNDNNWKETVEVTSRQHWEEKSAVAQERNTRVMQNAFNKFTTMFTTSINNIETLLFESSMNEIKRMKQEAVTKMQDMLKERIEIQAKRLYRKYTERLNVERNKRKANFLKKIEKAHTIMAAQIHDMRVEKHLVVEKLRHYLKTQNLACQVYVALKETDECKKEMDLAENAHKKKVKLLKEQLAMKDFQINLAQEKERKRGEFNTMWKKKVCEVVKKLQMFVTFCLSSLPEYADFFIDMEKLMLLQLNVVFENPQAESIFEEDSQEKFHTPVPKPHPFYLVCDKGNKPKIEEDLCPKHCTSSASHMPVVIVNKRCIYAACDNFQEFTTKITEFVHGRRGDDIDFEDDHEYELDVPLKYTSREHLKELKLESSLFQILQQERPNMFKLNLQCCKCNIPYCFCKNKDLAEGSTSGSQDASKDWKTSKGAPWDGDVTSIMSAKSKEPSVKPNTSEESLSSGNKVTREDELIHEREPKIGGYLEYILPKKCKCAKTAKKHLAQNLPPYMIATSKYEEVDLPNYEKCPVEILKKLVKKAQRKPSQTILPPEITPTHRDMATQYSNQQFDVLCACFSDDSINALLKRIAKGTTGEAEKFKTVDGDITPSILTRHTSSFATQCAVKLKKVLEDSPQLQEIFKKKDCNYDDE